MAAARGEPCADGLYISNFADLIVFTLVNAYPPLIVIVDDNIKYKQAHLSPLS